MFLVLADGSRIAWAARTMLKSGACILFSVLLLSIPSHGLAAPITLRLAGFIPDFPDGERTPFEDGTFELIFTYESAAPDVNPGDPESGVYFGAILSGHLTITTAADVFKWGIDPFAPNTNEILIHDTAAVNFFDVGPGLSGPSVAGLGTPTYVLAQFWDDDANAFTSDQLPLLTDITQFERTNLQLTFPGASPACCASLGQITEISVVPEPTTLFLLGFGAAATLRKRSRRASRETT